jgi:hypothetical protein
MQQLSRAFRAERFIQFEEPTKVRDGVQRFRREREDTLILTSLLSEKSGKFIRAGVQRYISFALSPPLHGSWHLTFETRAGHAIRATTSI